MSIIKLEVQDKNHVYWTKNIQYGPVLEFKNTKTDTNKNRKYFLFEKCYLIMSINFKIK